jgi:hypothetical protein
MKDLEFLERFVDRGRAAQQAVNQILDDTFTTIELLRGSEIVRALVRATNENGAPNSFGCSELIAHYGIKNATPMQVGKRATRRYSRTVLIAESPSKKLFAKYEKQRFIVWTEKL